MTTDDLGSTAALIFNGRSIPLAQRRTTIGRAVDNDVVVEDERVSRHHAVLEIDSRGQLWVTDRGSGNGTLIGGRRLRNESAAVSDGDTLTLGRTVIRVSLRTATAPSPSDEKTELGNRPAAAARQPALAAQQPAPAQQPPPPPPLQPPLPQADAPSPGGRRSGISRPSGITMFVRQTTRRLRIATGVAVVSVLVALAGAAVGVLAATGKFSKKPRPPLTVSQIIQRSRHSVVFVSALNAAGNGATGSGWVLNAAKGLIVTNGHVVEGGPRLTVRLPAGKARPAQLVAVNRCEDVALIRVADTSGLRTLPQGRQGAVHAGDPTIALGFPFSSATDSTDLTDTTGVVSVVRTHARFYPDVTETDAPINPGNSGGPLLDSDGRIIGMNTFGSTEGQNQGYAISINEINRLLPTLRTGTNQGWAGLGLQYDESGSDLPVATNAHGELFGPEITGVYPGGSTGVITGDTSNYKQYLTALDGIPFVPADELGLHRSLVGDPLPVGPGGKQLPDTSDGWCAVASKFKAGQQLPVTVLTLAKDGDGITTHTTLTFR